MIIRVQLLLDAKRGELQIGIPDQSVIRYGQLDLLCRCGERNDAESVFCGHCGERLEFATEYTTGSLAPLPSSTDKGVVQDEPEKDDTQLSVSGAEEVANPLTVALSDDFNGEAAPESTHELTDSSNEKFILRDQYESLKEPNRWYQERQLSAIGDSTRTIIDIQNLLKYSYHSSPPVRGAGINKTRLQSLMEFGNHVSKIHSAVTTLISQEFKAK